MVLYYLNSSAKEYDFYSHKTSKLLHNEQEFMYQSVDTVKKSYGNRDLVCRSHDFAHNLHGASKGRAAITFG